jgi:hypothetical protein
VIALPFVAASMLADLRQVATPNHAVAVESRPVRRQRPARP